MKKPIYLPALFLVFLLLFSINSLKASPGDSCANPYSISISTSAMDTSFTINDSVTWLTYTPITGYVGFAVYNSIDTSNAYVDSAIFYTGSCGTLSFAYGFSISKYSFGPCQ